MYYFMNYLPEQKRLAESREVDKNATPVEKPKRIRGEFYEDKFWEDQKIKDEIKAKMNEGIDPNAYYSEGYFDHYVISTILNLSYDGLKKVLKDCEEAVEVYSNGGHESDKYDKYHSVEQKAKFFVECVKLCKEQLRLIELEDGIRYVDEPEPVKEDINYKSEWSKEFYSRPMNFINPTTCATTVITMQEDCNHYCEGRKRQKKCCRSTIYKLENKLLFYRDNPWSSGKSFVTHELRSWYNYRERVFAAKEGDIVLPVKNSKYSSW